MIFLFKHRVALALTALMLTLAQANAATCPFDTGGSDAINDGVVLTRYALGITGAPLTASTRYASLDPLQVKANIECVGCALDVNQDGVVDTIDTTVIARHLAGFNGAAVTNGLGLTPAVAASVTSFLANGCAVGGAINAFVHGGNTFALAPGVPSLLGNTDSRPLTLKAPQSTIKLLVDPANGDDGLRISYSTNGAFTGPNTINGSRVNSVAGGVIGATIGGGGFFDQLAGAVPNQVNADHGTIGGGHDNTVVGQTGVVGGGRNNTAGAGNGAGESATVGGGNTNIASGDGSTVPGGSSNTAAGDYSFAAGIRAKANHGSAFVWADNTGGDVTSTGINQFVVRASGGIRLPGAGDNQPNNPAKQSGTNMFTHQVPTSGPCGNVGAFASRTAIDHPLTNGKPDAILVITPNFGTNSLANGGGNPVFGNPVAVYYEDTGLGGCPAGKWVIYGINGAGVLLANQKFNVLVINP
ncbi:MAG: hypothetical protein ABL985_07345 [Casimicrobium sp.]